MLAATTGPHLAPAAADGVRRWLDPPRAAASGAAGGLPARYRPPVDAPVADPFRPPPQPWLAGNRGIEYATAPGTPVAAIGPGLVTFAGPVARRWIVTVAHPGGLRSSSVGLRAPPAVVRGQRVEAGTLLGWTTGHLHLGVRHGETYVDPAGLWGRPTGEGRAVLVPAQPDPAAPP